MNIVYLYFRKMPIKEYHYERILQGLDLSKDEVITEHLYSLKVASVAEWLEILT